MTVIGRGRRALFGISLGETRVGRRGFHSGSMAAVERVERIGRRFLAGYHAALEEGSASELGARLNREINTEYRGFAFEGAGMALTLLDRLHLTRGAFAAFLEGAGSAHSYMLHVGAGWAVARLPWLRKCLDRSLASLDPLLRWLAVDGYGFHEGYFHWPESIRRQMVPDGVRGYARRCFDQGLGRSLWFVEGIGPDRVAATVAAFSPERRADLWSGVGLACAYAGGAGQKEILRLRDLAGEYLPAAAQGAAFAAECRRRAGNPAPHCDLVCRTWCGLSAEEAAAIPIEELATLPPDGAVPSYEVWRTRVQSRMAKAAAMRSSA
jgi:enediyne biosynthesis protein E3